MRSRVALVIIIAAVAVVIGTSAWTINEVGKNNRAVFFLTVRTKEAADAIAALTYGSLLSGHPGPSSQSRCSVWG
jgi:hypothetical protein